MDKVQKFILAVLLLLFLCAGITVQVGDLHWEYKGAIHLLYERIYE